MKKLHAILLTAGVAFFAYLVWSVGATELWRELAVLGWGLFPLMLGEGVAEMIHTVGWRYCLSGPLRSLPWSTLFSIRMAGYAINYLTPTAALGGEVTKAALLASHHRGPEAASGVLIGKVAFALAHLIFVTLGAAFVLWRLDLPDSLWAAMMVCGVLVGGGIITLLVLQVRGKLGAVFRWLAARRVGGRLLQKLARDFTTVDETLKSFFSERRGSFPVAIAWHLVGYSVGIFQTWLFFRLMHQEASFTVAAGMWFLGMWFDLLTFAVPMNLGTLEGTRILALKSVGYSAAMGMTYGLALRLAQLCWAGFGLGCQALLTVRVGPVRPSEPQPITVTANAAENSETEPLSPTVDGR